MDELSRLEARVFEAAKISLEDQQSQTGDEFSKEEILGVVVHYNSHLGIRLNPEQLLRVVDKLCEVMT